MSTPPSSVLLTPETSEAPREVHRETPEGNPEANPEAPLTPLDASSGAARPELIAALDRLLDTPPFTDPRPDTHLGQAAQAYREVRAVNAAVGGGRALLDDPLSLTALVEWCAVRGPSLALAALIHYAIAMPTVLALHRPGPAMDRIVDDLDRGTHIGGILLTEAGRSNSHLGVDTEAHYDPERHAFTLRTPHPGAVKLLAGAALTDNPRHDVVYARLVVGGTSYGTHVFLLPFQGSDGLPPPGLRFGERIEMPGAPLDYAAVRLDDVHVPYEYWLRDSAEIVDGVLRDPAPNDDHRLLRSLVTFAPAAATMAAAVSTGARAAVYGALAFCADRPSHERGGPRRGVMEYRTQQESLYGGMARAYALTAWGREVIGLHVAGGGPTSAPEPGDEERMKAAPWAAVNRSLALLKARSTAVAEEVASEARRRCGGQGNVSSFRLTDMVGLAQVSNSAAGDNLLMTADAARTLLEGVEYVPPLAPRTAPDPLAADGPTALARAREAGLFRVHAERVAQGTKAGLEGFALWNDLLPDALTFAEAHTTRLMCEALDALAGRARADGDREALEAVRDLYGLLTVRDAAAWHLENGTLSPDRARALRAALPSRLDRVRAHIGPLTAGLGLTARRLGARTTSQGLVAEFDGRREAR
ncbi:acyl-CoA dehydrogenase [Streptomyces sp. NPDC050504]|uniref:acyl-CoA dehydrogenase family protein n=1 Tax=Streptomyces sp. NPDC050504 TaxID=3365618 RepID=UPI0037A20E3C